MVFLLAGITNVSAINLETKSDQSTKTTNGSIKVDVVKFPRIVFAPEIAGSIVEIKGPNGYTEKKEVVCHNGCSVLFDNLEFSGIFGKFYLTVYPAVEGYKGTSNKLILLACYFPDPDMTPYYTQLYIWKEGESVSSSLPDQFSSYPLL